MQTIKQNWKRYRPILLAAALVNIFLWGAQGLIASQYVANLYGVKLPDDRFYVRIIGAFALAMGLLYYFAAKDPEKHKLIIKVAILKYGLLTVILAFLVMSMTFKDYLGLSTSIFWFWIANLVLCCFFTITLYALLPREDGA